MRKKASSESSEKLPEFPHKLVASIPEAVPDKPGLQYVIRVCHILVELLNDQSDTLKRHDFKLHLCI